METTFRGWSSTLAARVRLVLSRLILIFALPLDFHGRLRVVRSMYLLAALHGIEASLLASDSLRKLRSSVTRVVWSRRQPLASVCVVLSLLVGPRVTLHFALSGFGFVCLVGILLFGLRKFVGCTICLRWWVRVVLGMVLFIFFPLVLLRLVLGGILLLWLGLDLVCPLVGPVQHFKAAILDAWRDKVAADLCGRKGFRGGPLLDVHGSLQLLNSSHVRERDEALLRSVMVGGVWNGLLLGRVRSQVVPYQFRGAPDGDGHFLWECTFPPLVEIRENPEFHDLMRMDKEHGFLCCLVLMVPPLGQQVSYLVKAALGCYSSGIITE